MTKSQHSYLGSRVRQIRPVGTKVLAGRLLRGALTAPSAVAKHRLEILDWHRGHGSVLRLTARHFGLSPDTVSRWSRAFAAGGTAALEPRSRRPKHVRRPSTPSSVVIAIRAVREAHPRWGREKLRALLLRAGIDVSAKTIDRTIQRLRERGDLREAVSPRKASRARWRMERPRRPQGFIVDRPGALLQVDSKHLRLAHRPVFVLGAVDHFTRKRVVAVYPNLSSDNGAAFLERLRRNFPFPVEAIQTDGGAEFLGAFGAAAAAAGIRHYFNRPNYPQGQGRVERSFLTDEQEFYEVEELPPDIAALEPMLLAWNRVYEEIRPHQALGYLTPNEFYARWVAEHAAR